MALLDDLNADVDGVISATWNVRDGQVVPESADVVLAGGAVKLAATMLYADLADSTELAMNYDHRVAAKVYKCFLACSTRLIRAEGGGIRSFDGDRVMGIFVGGSKNTSATRCALMINYAFLEIIVPKLIAKYPDLKDGPFKLTHCVGIDTSDVLAVRGGIRADNDLLWIGRAPNIAAKMSAFRDSPYHSFITKSVYDAIADEAKYGGEPPESMWEKRLWKTMPSVPTVYRSFWMWRP